MSDLYFAALVKDAGCSSNSVRIHHIFGDDHEAKRAVKLIDWTKKVDCVKYAFAYMQKGMPAYRRLAKMVEAHSDEECQMDSLTAARCNRGAQIAIQLGFGEKVASAVLHLDEHWDGKGAPEHRAGDQIPVLASIVCLCQTLDVLVLAYGKTRAFRIIANRSGRWFDPSIAKVAREMEFDESLWQDSVENSRAAVLRMAAIIAPDIASEKSIDDICEAFAAIIDAKSSYTSEHSRRVTGYAVEIGNALQLESNRISDLRRAGLLHDIGKLAVPAAILEKNGKLDDAEFAIIRDHPRHTEEILGLIQGFGRITEIAAAHHERLDGRGYHRGKSAEALDLEMRILSVADVFDALTAKRPYRDALDLHTVFEIMEKDAGDALDPDLIGILKDRYGASTVSLAA